MCFSNLKDSNDFPVYPITLSSIQIVGNPFPSTGEISPQTKRRRVSFGNQTKSHDGQVFFGTSF